MNQYNTDLYSFFLYSFEVQSKRICINIKCSRIWLINYKPKVHDRTQEESGEKSIFIFVLYWTYSFLLQTHIVFLL